VQSVGLQGFTSSLVCVASHDSVAILKHVKADRYDEVQALRRITCRRKIYAIQSTPSATSMKQSPWLALPIWGPILPTMSNIEPQYFDVVSRAAKSLLAWDAGNKRLNVEVVGRKVGLPAERPA
jgi:dihydrodipicolinate synthase/N-acetylneuraminate lyase